MCTDDYLTEHPCDRPYTLERGQCTLLIERYINRHGPSRIVMTAYVVVINLFCLVLSLRNFAKMRVTFLRRHALNNGWRHFLAMPGAQMHLSMIGVFVSILVSCYDIRGYGGRLSYMVHLLMSEFGTCSMIFTVYAATATWWKAIMGHAADGDSSFSWFVGQCVFFVIVLANHTAMPILAIHYRPDDATIGVIDGRIYAYKLVIQFTILFLGAVCLTLQYRIIYRKLNASAAIRAEQTSGAERTSFGSMRRSLKSSVNKTRTSFGRARPSLRRMVSSPSSTSLVRVATAQADLSQTMVTGSTTRARHTRVMDDIRLSGELSHQAARPPPQQGGLREGKQEEGLQGRKQEPEERQQRRRPRGKRRRSLADMRTWASNTQRQRSMNASAIGALSFRTLRNFSRASVASNEARISRFLAAVWLAQALNFVYTCIEVRRGFYQCFTYTKVPEQEWYETYLLLQSLAAVVVTVMYMRSSPKARRVVPSTHASNRVTNSRMRGARVVTAGGEDSRAMPSSAVCDEQTSTGTARVKRGSPSPPVEAFQSSDSSQAWASREHLYALPAEGSSEPRESAPPRDPPLKILSSKRNLEDDDAQAQAKRKILHPIPSRRGSARSIQHSSSTSSLRTSHALFSPKPAESPGSSTKGEGKLRDDGGGAA